MKYHYISSPQQAKGSILIISLILLLVITAIGASAISSTGLNEKMASNYKDHGLAFQAAEAALAAGEQRAVAVSGVINAQGLAAIPEFFDCVGTNCFTADCLDGLCFTGNYPPTVPANAAAGVCDRSNPANNLWEDSTTWNTSTRYSEHPVTLQGIAQQPRYIIEFMCYSLANSNLVPTSSAPNYTSEWSFTYRISALGIGRSDKSKTMLQSTFKVAR